MTRAAFCFYAVAFLTAMVSTPTRSEAGEPRADSAAAFKIRSYGDDRPVLVSDELEELRSANAQLVGSVQREVLTFPVALARIRQLAQTAGGNAVLAPALRALPDNAPSTLRLLAVRELARGHPTAVFLLLLAAYDRDPASSDALTDLAGIVAGLGYANEALAFLDELKRRAVSPSPPLGISGANLLAYVRAYCLVRLGDVVAARPLLVQVTEKEPMLAEAARLFAIIADDEAEQRKYFLLGAWRHRSSLMICEGVDLTQKEADPLVTGDQVAIDLRSVVDLSKGTRGRLPDTSYTNSSLQANGLEPRLEALGVAISDQNTALSERQVRPRGFKHSETAPVEEVRGHRMLTLMTSLYRRDQRLRDLERIRLTASEDTRIGLRKLNDEKEKKAGEAMDAYFRAQLPRSPTPAELGTVIRPFYEDALQKARGIVGREEKAVRDLFAEWHLLASSIPPQVGDAAWWEYLRIMIERERLHSYNQLISLCRMQASVGVHPYITTEPGEDPPIPEPQDPQKCDGDKSVSFSTSELPGSKALPFEFGVEMTCEGMSVEVDVDTRIPGISVSTEVGLTTAGDMTAFIGPKASLTVGDKEIAAFNGTAKGGAFITGNRDGVKDAGLKYEVKVGGKIGAVSGAQKIAEGAVSFIPAPVTGGGDIEPLIFKGGAGD